MVNYFEIINIKICGFYCFSKNDFHSQSSAGAGQTSWNRNRIDFSHHRKHILTLILSISEEVTSHCPVHYPIPVSVHSQKSIRRQDFYLNPFLYVFLHLNQIHH